jgi:hypothetical protein
MRFMNFSSVRQLEGDAMFRRPTLIIVVVGFLPPRTEALVLSPLLALLVGDVLMGLDCLLQLAAAPLSMS